MDKLIWHHIMLNSPAFWVGCQMLPCFLVSFSLVWYFTASLPSWCTECHWLQTYACLLQILAFGLRKYEHCVHLLPSLFYTSSQFEYESSFAFVLLHLSSVCYCKHLKSTLWSLIVTQLKANTVQGLNAKLVQKATQVHLWVDIFFRFVSCVFTVHQHFLV